MAQAVSFAWSSNTLATRNSQWKKFILFCSSNNLQPLPEDHRTLSRFLVWIARNSKYSTVNNYLSAISVLHKYYGFDADFRDSFLIKLVLQGLKRKLGCQVAHKLPFPIGQLRSMYEVFDHTNKCMMALWAVMIFCFRTLLRKSNVLPDSAGKLHHVVKRSDVLDIPVHFVSDRTFCVAWMVESHIHDFPASPDSPLFLRRTSNGVSPVLYVDLLMFIKKLSSCIGLDQSKSKNCFYIIFAVAMVTKFKNLS